MNRRPVPHAPLTDSDQLLRAAVYAAFEAKETPGYGDACQRVIDVHRLWPLIEYEHAIEAALFHDAEPFSVLQLETDRIKSEAALAARS